MIFVATRLFKNISILKTCFSLNFTFKGKRILCLFSLTIACIEILFLFSCGQQTQNSNSLCLPPGSENINLFFIKMEKWSFHNCYYPSRCTAYKVRIEPVFLISIPILYKLCTQCDCAYLGMTEENKFDSFSNIFQLNGRCIFHLMNQILENNHFIYL